MSKQEFVCCTDPEVSEFLTQYIRPQLEYVIRRIKLQSYKYLL